MQVGKYVSYIDASGDRHQAAITDVLPAGPSGYRVLDLVYGPQSDPTPVASVPYASDAEPGGHYWILVGEKRPKETVEVVEEEAPARRSNRKR